MDSSEQYRLTAPLSLLWRPGGALQVGLDASGAVVLPGAPEGADLALRALRSARTLAEVSRLAPLVPRAWIAEAVTTLAALGLVAALSSTRAPTLTVAGDGVLAHAVASLLTAEGRPVVAAPDVPPDPHLTDLVVVCASTAEPDRVDLRELAGHPHLVVRAEPERVVVGPFVVPGAGYACVTCTDLVRRDLDRDWPHLLAQLCRSRHTATPQQTAWASALVSAQLTAWLGGRTPEASGATWELDAHRGQVGVRHWPRHPDCGCALVG